MELEKAIFCRRSVRKYKTEPIAIEDIMAILEAGMAAPSATNFQPWYFVAVRSEAKINEIVTIMQRASNKLAPDLQQRFLNHPEVAEDSRKFIGLLGGAPMCILAFQYKPEYPKKETAIIQSVAAAIQNMLLTAHSRGIGSCWLTAPLEAGVDVEIKNHFAPDKGDLVALLTFGYANHEPKTPARKENRFTIV